MEKKIYNIGEGDTAIKETLKIMKRLAVRDSKSPEIAKVAGEIFAKSKSKADIDIAKAAFDYVFKNIQYKYDHEIIFDHFKPSEFTAGSQNAEDIEFTTAPKYLISETKEGDCDDMSTLLASLHIALGLSTNFKVIAWKNNDPDAEFTHVYTEVKVEDGKKAYWIPSDPVIQEFGKEKAPIRRVGYYRVDEDENIEIKDYR